jgi:hypothetical protein
MPHAKTKKAIDDAGLQLIELVDDPNSDQIELEEEVAGRKTTVRFS